MEFRLVLFLCFWTAVAGASVQELKLEPDQPFERAPISSKATVRCCYNGNYSLLTNWIKNTASRNGTTFPQVVNMTERLNFTEDKVKNGIKCYSLVFSSVTLNDTGLYQCKLNYKSLIIFSHGTFLQVYIPLQKTLNLSESVKNSIITAEGVLLLMCVLMPGIMLLCKSKRLNELEKKKGREEENIYEGLNLDECNSAYHQIQRSCQQGPYQDVGSCEEDIQLEKP